MTLILTAENYKSGFLVDDETIAGVTEMEGGAGEKLFSAYVSHYLTGETLAYREFDRLNEALEFLGSIDRPWAFEAVGCSARKTGAGAQASSCGTGCGGGACKSCG